MKNRALFSDHRDSCPLELLINSGQQWQPSMNLCFAMQAHRCFLFALCCTQGFPTLRARSGRNILRLCRSRSEVLSAQRGTRSSMNLPGTPPGNNARQSEKNSILTIRPAASEDIPTLTRWDTEPHVVAATSDDPSTPELFDWAAELTPREDGTSFYMAVVDSRPIGILGVIDPAREQTHYWGASAPNLRAVDIWIGEKDALGRGYGTQMMEWVIELCFRDPLVRAILVDPLFSNTRAHRFYRRFGFVDVHRRQFDRISDCLVMRLQRDAYLARLGER